MRIELRIVLLSILLGILLVFLAKEVRAQVYGSPLWDFDAIDPVTALTVISDVTGDDFPEVMVGSRSHYIHCLEANTGLELWYAITSGVIWSMIGIGDINGDSQEDIVVGTDHDKIQCFSGDVVSGIGHELWSFSLTGNDQGDVWILTSINDMDNDGCPEVVAGTAGDLVLCLSGRTGQELWRYRTVSDIFAVTRFVDINQDGKDEVLGGGYGNLLYCLDGTNGHDLWTHDVGGTIWALNSIEDLDGDNIREVLVGTDANSLICLSGNPSLAPADRELWRFQANGDIRAIKVVEDISGDSFPDVFFGSADNYLYLCSGKTGELIWQKNTSGEVFSLDLVQDLTCDKKAEVVAGTQMSSVHCLSGNNGRTLWYYPFEEIGPVKKLVSVPDSTGDQVSEIVAASNKMVVCLDGAAAIPLGSCLVGDADCNHKTELNDALLALQLLSGVRISSGLSLPGFCEPGDADQDGSVTLADVILILRLLSEPRIE